MPRVPTHIFVWSSFVVMARAPTTPVAQISALKPLGSFSLSIGISLAGVSVFLPGFGASFESFRFSGWPCFQIGGGAGLSRASAACTDNASTLAAASVNAVFFMVSLPCEAKEITPFAALPQRHFLRQCSVLTRQLPRRHRLRSPCRLP